MSRFTAYYKSSKQTFVYNLFNKQNYDLYKTRKTRILGFSKT